MKVTLALALVVALVVPAASQTPSFTGSLLVATESMRDPRFHRAVIYMVRHDASGALGLIVNRPVIGVPAANLLKDLGRESPGATGTIRVHYGGPVEPLKGFVLHTSEWKASQSHAITDDISVTTATSILAAIADGTGPRRSLFALGYSGWAPGQLEGELAAGAWIVVPADEALVFDDDAPSKWDRAIARRKITL